MYTMGMIRMSRRKDVKRMSCQAKQVEPARLYRVRQKNCALRRCCVPFDCSPLASGNLFLRVVLVQFIAIFMKMGKGILEVSVLLCSWYHCANHDVFQNPDRKPIQEIFVLLNEDGIVRKIPALVSGL